MINIGKTSDFIDTLFDLRMELHNYNLTITHIEGLISDPLTKLSVEEFNHLVVSNQSYRQRRRVIAQYIEELITVVCFAVSLESRIFGFLNYVLSFRVIKY